MYLKRLFSILVFLGALTASAAYALPLEFIQQGQVFGRGDRPLEGEHNVHIRIYEGDNVVFEEIHVDVDIYNGYYSIIVGSINNIFHFSFLKSN